MIPLLTALCCCLSYFRNNYLPYGCLNQAENLIWKRTMKKKKLCEQQNSIKEWSEPQPLLHDRFLC